ncbi:MAG: hypothetical protein HQM00_16115 [Magnetococcales bacterium]|nr:hypothetical protein [Magnetococcales bacterium]
MCKNEKEWWEQEKFGCYHEEIGTKDTTGMTFLPCMGPDCWLFNEVVPCVHAQIEEIEEE